MQQDSNKTNSQLLDELRELRQRNSELEAIVSTLIESEERFRVIADYAYDWETWVDPDGKIIWVNPAVEKITGYSVEEYLHLPDRLKQIFLDEDRNRALSHIENGLRHRRSGNDVEFQIRRKDGSLKWGSISYQPIYTKKGECLGLRSSVRDISERKHAEKLLAETKEFLDNIIDNALDCIVVTDNQGYITRVNKYFTDMLGYREDEIRSKYPTEGYPKGPGSYQSMTGETVLLDEEFFNNGRKMYKQLMEHGHISNWESYAIKTDGRAIPVTQNIVLLYNKQQEMIGSVAIIRDETEKKKAENQLRASHANLRALINAAPEGLFLFDIDGTVIIANETIAKRLGTTVNKLVGSNIYNYHPKDLVASRRKFVEQAVSERKMLYFEDVRGDRDLANYIYPFSDKIGDSTKVAVSSWDITERKHHEEALREREERFRTIAESSLDAIITADSSGKILYWNKAAETMYGYKAKEIVGKSIELLRPEGKRLTDRKNRDIFIKTGRSRYVGKRVEGPARKKDGTLFLTETSTAYWKIGGKIIFGGIVRDITERKQMEEQLKKAHNELEKKVKQRTAELREANEELKISREYLKKFAGMQLSAREEERKNISTTLHDELGSMAVSVNSKITIAREEVKDNNRNAALEALAQGQAALQKAVGDLRRLAVDLRPPNLESMGLSVVLTDFLNKTKEHAKFKITFSNELGNKKIADATAIVIYRVIQEALTNITKHAKAKNVKVWISGDRSNINLEITDDGVGLKQGKATSRKGNETLKIGIEGMRERVELLGGEFIITSAPKQGTQIKAILPIK
jgi:PAS domain S-box-containing protein